MIIMKSSTSVSDLVASYPSQWKNNFFSITKYHVEYMIYVCICSSLTAKFYYFCTRVFKTDGARTRTKDMEDTSRTLVFIKHKIKENSTQHLKQMSKTRLYADLSIAVWMFPFIFITRIIAITATIIHVALALIYPVIVLVSGAVSGALLFVHGLFQHKGNLLTLPIHVLYCLAFALAGAIGPPILSVAFLVTEIIDLIVLFIPTMIGELILALPIIGQLLCIAIRYYNGFYKEPDETANISSEQVDWQQPCDNTDDPSFYQLTTLL